MSEQKATGQALVNMKSGDKIILDVSNQAVFVKLSSLMEQQSLWFLWEDRILLNKGDIASVYFLPEGYEASCGGSASTRG